MAITSLNHAVLYVSDLEDSREFYVDALGFEALAYEPGRMLFLRAAGSTNDHDLGLFQIGTGAGPSAAGRSTVGLYHLAWEVDTLGELERFRTLLSARGSLTGATNHATTKSLYARDPDGLEFELCWVVPAAHVEAELAGAGPGRLEPLDLAAEIERYGADTRGGIGVSVPAAT